MKAPDAMEITDEVFLRLTHDKYVESKPIIVGEAVGFLIRGYIVQTPNEAGLVVDEFVSSLSEKNRLLLELFDDPDLELINVAVYMKPWYVRIEPWDRPKYGGESVPCWRSPDYTYRFQNHRPRGKLSDLENVESIWTNEEACRKYLDEWETRWANPGRR